MTHSRLHDPFSAHETAEPTTDDGIDDEGLAVDDTGDGLEDLSKAELIDLAVSRGVAMYGTKRDIADRIRS